MANHCCQFAEGADGALPDRGRDNTLGRVDAARNSIHQLAPPTPSCEERNHRDHERRNPIHSPRSRAGVIYQLWVSKTPPPNQSFLASGGIIRTIAPPKCDDDFSWFGLVRRQAAPRGVLSNWLA